MVDTMFYLALYQCPWMHDSVHYIAEIAWMDLEYHSAPSRIVALAYYSGTKFSNARETHCPSSLEVIVQWVWTYFLLIINNVFKFHLINLLQFSFLSLFFLLSDIVFGCNLFSFIPCRDANILFCLHLINTWTWLKRKGIERSKLILWNWTICMVHYTAIDLHSSHNGLIIRPLYMDANLSHVLHSLIEPLHIS